MNCFAYALSVMCILAHICMYVGVISMYDMYICPESCSIFLFCMYCTINRSIDTFAS